MPTASKQSPKQHDKQRTKQSAGMGRGKKGSAGKKASVGSFLARKKQLFTARLNGFLDRRPHRSFRLTRRRDYSRPLDMPGYIAFTHHINKTLWQHKKLFGLLIVLFTLLYMVLIGLVSQENYTMLSDTINQTNSDLLSGFFGTLEKSGLLLATLVSSFADTSTNESQQVIVGLLFLLLWLVTVWLLRTLLAGHRAKLRDGLYNAGAPIVSTLVIFLLIMVQLLPVALAFMGYTAASSTGLLNGGVSAMLFWLGATLLGVLSLYWITSSLFAAVIVTLPGMYPFKAIQTAGDLVLGRRMRILFRWLWMLLMLFLTWLVVMLPLVLLDSWLRSFWPWLQNVPVLPLIMVVMVVGSVVWAATYVYVLYRRVVDNALA